ncbi:LANO_0G11584g1_1 [Lachancea nothofagi CBS 11611]|uniref:LANO_0G11584g1_1 n=1 Tax=Lachancea nothofagi CBS 11611 TaxID=1266666 RepID=A0A1G4KJC9_9SACH|nr:LANO_0G11584g1_1 [Lachancea nothofagi CBS 11611]
MSTYSRFFNAPAFTSPVSAGPETHHLSQTRRKRSFDDLLLPSLNFESPQLCYHNSPYLFQPLVVNPSSNKRARTAPASPTGMDIMTPKTSPLLTKVDLNTTSFTSLPSILNYSADSASQSQPQPNDQSYVPASASVSQGNSFNSFYNPSSITLASADNNNQDESESDEHPQLSDTTQCGPLPSLKHLQLLPNPKIQELAYRYPDTSENTQSWRESLLSWCRNENYNDYLKITKEVRDSARNSHAPGLSTLANVASLSQSIPSILNPPDEFRDLSNTLSYGGVVTPPMSPRSAHTTSKSSPIFTPVMSEKLVQCIKERRSKSHKKTNSFKARELKKLLNDRDVLSNDSRGRVEKPARKRKPSLPSSPHQFIMKISGLTSPKSLTKSSTKVSPRGSTHEDLPPESTPLRTDSPPRAHVFVLNEPQTPTKSVNFSSEVGPSTVGPMTQKPSSPKRGTNRTCISCLSSDSPCWRPSWTSKKQDQLCNSCGLRYKKTQTRCLNDSCRKIPSKGELAIMKANGMISRISPEGTVTKGLGCLFCNSMVETRELHEHR